MTVLSNNKNLVPGALVILLHSDGTQTGPHEIIGEDNLTGLFDLSGFKYYFISESHMASSIEVQSAHIMPDEHIIVTPDEDEKEDQK